MGVDLLISRNRSDDAGAEYPFIGFKHRFPLSRTRDRYYYYNISFAPTRKNHRPIASKWGQVIFPMIIITMLLCNYIIYMINNFRDYNIRNGFRWND